MDAESTELARLGVTRDPDRTWRTRGGRAVDEATVAPALAKGISPEQFQRPYLREGHAAGGPLDWLHGYPEGPAARPGPAGPAEGIGSGTADRSMTTADAAKGSVMPGRFQRGYLTGGHEANSPAVTGHQAVVPMPMSDPAEPSQFARGALCAEHERVSPGDAGPSNPVPPGSPGSVLYGNAAAGYNHNREQHSADHSAMTGMIASRPAMQSYAPPADMRAASVPQHMTLGASKPAPGE